MKCSKCNFEWNENSAKLDKCPICGQMACVNNGKSKVSNFCNLSDALEEIIRFKGLDILRNQDLVLSMLKDIAPKLKVKKLHLKCAFDSGVWINMLNAVTGTIQDQERTIRKSIKILIDLGFQEDICRSLILDIAKAFYHNDELLENQNICVVEKNLNKDKPAEKNTVLSHGNQFDNSSNNTLCISNGQGKNNKQKIINGSSTYGHQVKTQANINDKKHIFAKILLVIFFVAFCILSCYQIYITQTINYSGNFGDWGNPFLCLGASVCACFSIFGYLDGVMISDSISKLSLRFILVTIIDVIIQTYFCVKWADWSSMIVILIVSFGVVFFSFILYLLFASIGEKIRWRKN